MKQITILSINYEQSHYIKRMLETMDYYDPGISHEDFKHIIWDNLSPKNDFKNVSKLNAKHELIAMKCERNIWGARATNHLLNNGSIDTPYLLWLAPDSIVLTNGWLANYLKIFASNPDIMAVGLYEKHLENCREAQDSKWVALMLEQYGIEFDHCGHLSSTRMMIKSDIFKKIGGYLEVQKGGQINRSDEIVAEVEFTIKMRRLGLKYIDAPFIKTTFYHFGAPHSSIKIYEDIIETEKKLGLKNV